MYAKKKSILSAIEAARTKRALAKKGRLNITVKQVRTILNERLPFELADDTDIRIQKYIELTNASLT